MRLSCLQSGEDVDAKLPVEIEHVDHKPAFPHETAFQSPEILTTARNAASRLVQAQERHRPNALPFQMASR